MSVPASAAGRGGRPYLTIGEVLGRLRPEFPDVTISKIRFLESEGLVEPDRTSAGYRKFAEEDVDRLRFVLEAQRDQYLPLRVIREQLADRDRGLAPEPTRPTPTPGTALPAAQAFTAAPSEIRLSRSELAEAAGLDEDVLAELERFGLVTPRAGGSHYDGDALAIARTVASMNAYGVEPRHLRPFRTAADREVGLIEQIISPYARGRGADRERASAVIGELSALSVRLHAALVRAALSAQTLR